MRKPTVATKAAAEAAPMSPAPGSPIDPEFHARFKMYWQINGKAVEIDVIAAHPDAYAAFDPAETAGRNVVIFPEHPLVFAGRLTS